MGLLESTISPNWFFAIQDMYNWGNKDVNKQIHYVNIDIGYLKGANRIAIGYGKKRIYSCRDCVLTLKKQLFSCCA